MKRIKQKHVTRLSTSQTVLIVYCSFCATLIGNIGKATLYEVPTLI